MTATTKLYTAEDLWQMPTDQPWELWEGELRKVPGAGVEASSVAGVIFALLLPIVRADDLGVLTGADGTYILARDPDTVLVPDVAFVGWEQLPGHTRPPGYAPVPPASRSRCVRRRTGRRTSPTSWSTTVAPAWRWSGGSTRHAGRSPSTAKVD